MAVIRYTLPVEAFAPEAVAPPVLAVTIPPPAGLSGGITSIK